MTKGTILIIEDNEEFRKIYGDRLIYEGFDILEAEDGEKGLALLREHSVQLIITDINMPKLDGFGFIEAIKKNKTLMHIPIVVMSVFDTHDHMVKAREMGAEGYIVKGTQTPIEVARKVQEVMAQAQKRAII